jgi:hypothetical protein
MLRGYCMASLPPGALVPITACFAALGCALVLRSAFDLARPLPVGDWRESSRLLLHASLCIGLMVLFVVGAEKYAVGGMLPEPDKFAPLLRAVVIAVGALIVLRAVARILLRLFRPPPDPSSFIPELDARTPVHETEPLPPMLVLPNAEVDRPSMWQSNLPVLATGLALLAAGLAGWDMDSLCLLRLPK